MKKRNLSALISVYSKDNLNPILEEFKKNKINIFSTGGTYEYIKKQGFKATAIETLTKYPSILNGRVKSLHPKIFGGILAIKNKKTDKEDVEKYKIPLFDFVIVDLYPFKETIASTQDESKIIEKIDIGGISLIRAAAKNYKHITVVSSKEDYNQFYSLLKYNKGIFSIKEKKLFATKAFKKSLYYDSCIYNYFENNKEKKHFYIDQKTELRYGENPHQEAAIYSFFENINLVQINGKKLSYNNYNDIFSSLAISKSLPKNKGTVIVKHTNPCGVSINKDKLKSYQYALACDPTSAFGGVVSCNFKVNANLATEINKLFFEVILANGFEKDALRILKRKKNLRIIDVNKVKLVDIENILSNFNTMLIQKSDINKFTKKNFKVVSIKKPNSKTFNNLIFAFNVCRFVKSNAIVLVNKDSTVGIGGGQPSRIDSCNIAINKMNKFQKPINKDEIIAASDAFFPFVDGFERLVQAGVKAVIQPYGSINDKKIIKFANETKTILVFAKTRHFKH